MADPRICDAGTFPFYYYDTDHSYVNGTLDNNGECIFPDANCGPDLPTKDCCDANKSETSYPQIYLVLAIVQIIPLIYVKLSKTVEEKEEYEKEKHRKEPKFLANMGRLEYPLTKLFNLGLIAYIGVLIGLSITLNRSYQATMAVNERNALMSVQVFMAPFDQIFQFIEDIVMVRMMYALGRGDKKITDKLVHTGLVGSILAGIIAGIIGTIIVFIQPARDFFASPGLENSMLLYPDCEFIGNYDSDNIIPLWLLKSWKVIFVQIGMVMSGLMFGSRNINAYGWTAFCAFAIQGIVWYTQVSTFPNTLTLMGLSEFCQAAGIPIFSIIYLMTPIGSTIREDTGVSLSFSKLIVSMKELFGRESDATEEHSQVENDTGKSDSENYSRALLMDGLKIMVIDLVLEGATLVTIYLALLKDQAIGYQITALQSEEPAFGVAYAYTMGIVTTLAGSFMIARGRFKRYIAFTRITVICVLVFIPVIIVSIVPFVFPIAYYAGTNSCEFAYDTQCVPFFSKVFGTNALGGKFTLPFTFNALAFSQSTDSIFIVLRAVLISMKDFDYLLYSTLAAGFMYIPAILVVTLAPTDFKDQAISYYIAMNIPQMILILTSLPRIHFNLKRMQNGMKGPWSDEVAKPTNNKGLEEVVNDNEDDEADSTDRNHEKSESIEPIAVSSSMAGTVSEIPTSTKIEDC